MWQSNKHIQISGSDIIKSPDMIQNDEVLESQTTVNPPQGNKQPNRKSFNNPLSRNSIKITYFITSETKHVVRVVKQIKVRNPARLKSTLLDIWGWCNSPVTWEETSHFIFILIWIVEMKPSCLIEALRTEDVFHWTHCKTSWGNVIVIFGRCRYNLFDYLFKKFGFFSPWRQAWTGTFHLITLKLVLLWFSCNVFNVISSSPSFL